jgi:hypothetical protein
MIRVLLLINQITKIPKEKISLANSTYWLITGNRVMGITNINKIRISLRSKLVKTIENITHAKSRTISKEKKIIIALQKIRNIIIGKNSFLINQRRDIPLLIIT